MSSLPRPLLRYAVGLCAAGFLVSSLVAPVHAGVVVNGLVDFDEGFATFELTSPGTQTGLFRLRQGGVDTTSTYSADVVTGTDPLTGLLTQVGDGLGFAATVASGNDGTFGVGFDAGLSVWNTSLTDTFEIVFKTTFSNFVDADGADAYSDSELSIQTPPGSEVIFTDLISDTLFGDQVGGILTGTSGDPQSESGMVNFSLTLAPSASQDISVFYTLRGGSFEATSSSVAEFSTFLEIQSITNVSQPPNVVPEPSTLLAGLGLVGCGAFRRRSRKQRS